MMRKEIEKKVFEKIMDSFDSVEDTSKQVTDVVCSLIVGRLEDIHEKNNSGDYSVSYCMDEMLGDLIKEIKGE